MNKRDFVRRYVERRFDRAGPDIDRLVREGERLWQRLSERGYGARREQGPREHVDWYARLSPQQQAWFDAFWEAFALKRGKQRAAMRWGQINPDEELARWIVDAAAAEAQRKLPEGQSRKMAEGWLAERRWEDHAPTRAAREQDAAEARNAELRRLRAEVAHLERLVQRERNPDTAQQLRDQVDDLRGRIAVLEQDNDG